MQAHAASDSVPPPAPIPIDRAKRRRAFKPTILRTRLYISVEECAAVLGWPVQRTRRHLRSRGALIKRGRYFYTTKGLLRRCLPEESAEFIAGLEQRREERGES